MNKKVILGIVAVIIVFAAGAWWLASSMPSKTEVKDDHASADTTSSSPADEGTKVDTGNASPSSDTAATITYTDSGFSPNSLTVKANTTIQIINRSSGTLQFSSDDHPTHTHDTELNMTAIQSGHEGTLKVTKTGTWGYHNHLQPSDTGKLTVTE